MPSIIDQLFNTRVMGGEMLEEPHAVLAARTARKENALTEMIKRCAGEEGERALSDYINAQSEETSSTSRRCFREGFHCCLHMVLDGMEAPEMQR